MSQSSKKEFALNRRMFLKGLGGSLISCPMLTSLLSPTEARAAAAGILPRFVHWQNTPYGGLLPINIFPTTTSGMVEGNLYSDKGHKYRISNIESSNRSVVSNSGSYTWVRPGMVNAFMDTGFAKHIPQMNAYMGCDSMIDLTHNKGATGAYQTSNTVGNSMERWPTIEHVIGNLRDKPMGIQTPVIMLSQEAFPSVSGSLTWASGVDLRSGPPISQPRGVKMHELFDQLFANLTGGGDPTSSDTKESLLVDRAYESYKRLARENTQSGRRLSSEDKQKLEAHMSYLFDIEQSLKNQTSASSCETKPPRPNKLDHYGPKQYIYQDFMHDNNDQGAEVGHIFSQIVLQAFACDVSRCAYLDYHPYGFFAPNKENKLHGITHDMHRNENHQDWGIKHRKFFYDKYFLPFLDMMSSTVEANGKTILENSLVITTEESSIESHRNINWPVFSWGSAAGNIRTGKLFDYRSSANDSVSQGNFPTRPNYRGVDEGYPSLARNDQTYFHQNGIPYNRLLANFLRAFGVLPSQYERGHKGYGDITIKGWQGDTKELYNYQLNDITEWLPGLKA